MGIENVDVVLVNGVQGAVAGLPQDFEPLTAPGPYVVTIVAIEDLGAGLVIRLPINPESWQRTLPQSWQARGAALARKDKLDWSGNPPANTTFTALLQEQDPRTLEAQVLKPLEGWRDRIQQSTQEPPAAILTFGAHQYRVVLTDVSVRRIRTNENGDATVAEISISALDQNK